MKSKLNLNVLYVEDEEAIRECMGNFLKRRFNDVFFASNGKDGLAKFEELKPDVVIVDIEMPIMDGVTMSQKIRTTNADIPIIFTTAFNEAFYIEQGKEIGVLSYLLKPVDYDELDDVISRLSVIYQQNN